MRSPPGSARLLRVSLLPRGGTSRRRWPLAAVPERKTDRWVASVTSDSTHPPAGLFTKDAATIARSLASKRVSPKGPASGMRMLTYFINRAGRGLSASRREELERAKRLLSRSCTSAGYQEGEGHRGGQGYPRLRTPCLTGHIEHPQPLT